MSVTPRLTNYILITNPTYQQASSAQLAFPYSGRFLLLPFHSDIRSAYMDILHRHGLALYSGMVHSGIIGASIAGGFRIPVMRVGLPICACFNLLATQPTHVALAAGAPASNSRLLTSVQIKWQMARHDKSMRQTTIG
jgi:hypothetical protein